MADDINKPKGVGPVNSADNSRFETMADRETLGNIHQRNVNNATSTAAYRKLEHRAATAQQLLEQQQARAAELKQKIIDAQVEIQKQVNAQYEQRLREIEAQKGRGSQDYQMMNRARRAHVQAAINQSSQNMAGTGEEPTLLDRRINYAEHVDTTIPKIGRHVNKSLADLEMAREEAGITAANQTARYVDARSNPRAIASDVNSVKSSIRNIDEIRANINLPTGALESRSEQLNARIQQIAEEKKNIAKSRAPDSAEQLDALDKEERQVRFRLGVNEGARDEQRHQRIDDRSLMRIAHDDQKRYKGTLERIGYQDKVMDEKAKMGQQSGVDAYEDAISGLKEALEKAADAAKEFEENIHKASNETERQEMINKKRAADEAVSGAQTRVDAAKSKVNDEANREAMSQRYIRAGARASSAIGDGLYYYGVTRRNETDSLGTAFANVATDMYQDTMSVGRNQDIRAFRRLSEGYSLATGAGEDSRGFGTAAAGFDAGSSLLQAGGDAIGGFGGAVKDGAGGTAGKGGAMPKGMWGKAKFFAKKIPFLGLALGAADAAPAAINAAKSADRMFDGRAGGSAAIDRYGHAMAAFNAMNEVENTQIQSALDYRRNAGMNVVGAGSGGAGIFDYATSEAGLNNFAKAGISKQDTNILMQQGVAALGKDFDVKDIEKSGRARMAGVMDTTQYISALGQLQGAGGKSEDLEKIMRSAISAGMDDAKSIMALVSSISDLAAREASVTGTSNIGAFNNQASNIMSNLDPSLSAAMRTQMAQDAMSKIKRDSSSTALDIPNVIEMGKYQRMAQQHGLQLTGGETEAMLKMDVAETNEMSLLAKEGKLDKVRESYEEKGIRVPQEDAALSQFVKDHAAANRVSALQRSTGFYKLSPDMQQKMEAEVHAGKDLSKSEDPEVRRSLKNIAYTADINATGLATGLAENRSVAKKGVEDIDQGAAGINRQAGLVGRATADSKELIAGEKAAKRFNTTLDDLATAMTKFMEKVDVEKMAKDQKGDAKNFDFPQSTKNLNEAAQALLKAAARIGGGPVPTPRIDNNGGAKKQ